MFFKNVPFDIERCMGKMGRYDCQLVRIKKGKDAHRTINKQRKKIPTTKLMNHVMDCCVCVFISNIFAVCRRTDILSFFFNVAVFCFPFVCSCLAQFFSSFSWCHNNKYKSARACVCSGVSICVFDFTIITAIAAVATTVLSTFHYSG